MDGESDQVGNDDRDGRYQAREVDLAEQMRIAGEGGRSACQAVVKVIPHHSARHVEQHLRQSVRGQAGDVTEYNREYHRSEERLDEEPEWSEDGLLVARDEITSHEHTDQVAIMPHIAQLQVIPFLARGDDEIPGFFLKYIYWSVG